MNKSLASHAKCLNKVLLRIQFFWTKVLLCTQNVCLNKSLYFAPTMFEQKSSFASNFFEKKSRFAPKMFEQNSCCASNMFEQNSRSYFAPKLFEQKSLLCTTTFKQMSCFASIVFGRKVFLCTQNVWTKVQKLMLCTTNI